MRARRPLIQRPPAAPKIREHDRRLLNIERAPVKVDVSFLTPVEEKLKKKMLRQRFNAGGNVDNDDLLNTPEPPEEIPPPPPAECGIALIAEAESTFDVPDEVTLEYDLSTYFEESEEPVNLELYFYMIDPSTPVVAEPDDEEFVWTQAEAIANSNGGLYRYEATVTSEDVLARSVNVSGAGGDRIIALLFATRQVVAEAASYSDSTLSSGPESATLTAEPPVDVPAFSLSVICLPFGMSGSLSNVWTTTDETRDLDPAVNTGLGMNYAIWNNEGEDPDVIPQAAEWDTESAVENRPLISYLYFLCDPGD